ncbi:FAD-dependent monooxygenase [Actinocorallia aurea]
MSIEPLRGLRVLISGAGVAGPALAYWLARYGAEPTVVEIAPALRTSGFAVDFRGPTHLGVLERMGVLDELRALQTHGGEMRRVDARDRPVFTLPAAFAGGEIEVLRADLSRVLHAAAADRVEYLFGDVIEHAVDTGEGVRVEFARHPARDFHLVVGADGLHSGVRRLLFGPEREYVRHLGYYVAGWKASGVPGAEAVPRQYNEPGRMISFGADPRDADAAAVFATFAGPGLDFDWHDVPRQKEFIAAAYAGVGWHAPRLVAALADAPEIYFDTVSKVRAASWWSGRAALLGDAAWGVTLGGMGVGTGLVGAYVLAGELAASGGDPGTALPAYERRMRPYADRWQRGASPGRFLAPRTGYGLRLRDTLFARSWFQRLLIGSTGSMAAADLPDYLPA